MDVAGHAVSGLLEYGVLFLAPIHGRPVQIRNVVKDPSGEEVFLYKSHQTLYFALGVGVVWLAERGLEAYIPHKRLVVFLPNRLPGRISLYDNAFHVVGKDAFGHAHIAKSVQHSNEQVFLLGIREEFNIPVAAVVADHGEAGYRIFCPGRIHNLCESPVHLVGIARLRCITAPTVFLRRR